MGPADLLGILILIAVGLALASWFGHASPPARARLRIMAEDPALVAARERARASWDRFCDLTRRHPDASLVKMRIDHPDGEYRGQWADVRSVDDDGVLAVVRGSSVAVRIERGELEDWQVGVEGGRYWGAFTVLAVWRIRERETGTLPIDVERQRARFLDADPV